MTGMGARNTAPHQKCARSRPPTAGPIAPPSEKLAIQTLTANVLSRSSRNMLLINDSVEGASVAPAIPSSARAAMGIPALREKRRRAPVDEWLQLYRRLWTDRFHPLGQRLREQQAKID
jgi:hypothetical protein